MPALTQEDVKSWGLPKLREEYGEALDRVQAIREENGGTLKGVAGDAADEVQNLMATTNLLGEQIDARKELDGADEHFEKVAERMEGVERPPLPGANGGKRKEEGPQDIGSLFLKSDAFKQFRESGRRDVPVSVPTAAMFGPGVKGHGEVPAQRKLQTTDEFPSPEDFRYDWLTDTLYQPNNVGPLLAQGSTDAQSISYPVESVIATGAAATAEGDTKPEAEIEYDPTVEPVRKIAVYYEVTDEAFEDEPFLRSILNGRLRLFVSNEEDRQILLGDDTATPPELEGILERSGIDSSSSYSLGGSDPDQALIDEVFRAAMRVGESFLQPDAFALRRATWETIRLAKDGNRNYLLGPPSEDAPTRLWGLQGVLNENMPSESSGNTPVLVGAFGTGAMLVRRSGIDLAITNSHDTHFAENKLAIRAEERVALAVFRPAAFATVESTT